MSTWNIEENFAHILIVNVMNMQETATKTTNYENDNAGMTIMKTVTSKTINEEY